MGIESKTGSEFTERQHFLMERLDSRELDSKEYSRFLHELEQDRQAYSYWLCQRLANVIVAAGFTDAVILS